MNKKRLFLVSIASLFSLQFVSATQSGPVEGFEKLLTGLLNMINILIKYSAELIFGDMLDKILFSKVLLLLLIYVVVYTTLGKSDRLFGENKPARFTISAIVAILAIKFIPENDLIEGILMPYNVFGIAISVFLPYILYLYFVEDSKMGSIGKKAAWILYGIVYIGLMAMRYSQGGLSETANYIYWSGALAILIAILFNNTIHKLMSRGKINHIEEGMKTKSRISLLDQLDILYNQRDRGVFRDNPEDFKREEKRLKKLLRSLS